MELDEPFFYRLSESSTDETLDLFIRGVAGEIGAKCRQHLCVFIGCMCTKMHIVPVAVLPGIKVGRVPHDLDLYRWVPLYDERSIIDPEDCLFASKAHTGDATFSFYYESQRLARFNGSPENKCVTAMCPNVELDPWLGNIMVVKTVEITPASSIIQDITESDLDMIATLLSEALSDGIGFDVE